MFMAIALQSRLVRAWKIHWVKRKIAGMGRGTYKPGSSSKPGHLYSPLPFPEFNDIPWQREACFERLVLIHDNMPQDLTGKKLLDIGCHTGFYCFKFTELGFYCTGIEIDPLSTEIARDVNQIYRLNIDFICAEATTDLIDKLGHFDVCLFLSIFQWVTFFKHNYTYHYKYDLTLCFYNLSLFF